MPAKKRRKVGPGKARKKTDNKKSSGRRAKKSGRMAKKAVKKRSRKSSAQIKIRKPKKSSRKKAVKARPEQKISLKKPVLKKAPSRLKNIILIIMDGWGIRKTKKANAVALARTPNIDFLAKNYPTAVICASDRCVGLPKGQMGNSEVGHMNIGAGRVVGQELIIITRSIKNGKFFRNKALTDAFKKGKRVHLMGLVSDGGIHSHIEHLFALLKMAKKYRKHVFVHAFLDGRDTPKQSAGKYLKQLEKKLQGIGEIATISGRYYAMDRDHRWERTEKAYNCIALGRGKYSRNPSEGLEEAYKGGETDEFVTPTLTSMRYRGVEDGDSIIFFNFREDRARQLTNAFIENTFLDFRREKKKVDFVEMVKYESDDKVDVAFQQPHPLNTIGEIMSKNKLSQLRIAETEKYAHVTFFMSGSREKPFPGEERVLIPSPKVATYDLQPEMSAEQIKDEVIKRIRSKKYSLIILNFANPDMVGHTGDLDATIKANEIVDRCVGEIVKEIKAVDGAAVITADHGNSEEMSGPRATTHTTNPVPLILVSNYKYRIKKKGALCNIAPTVLKLLGLKKPKEMRKGML